MPWNESRGGARKNWEDKTASSKWQSLETGGWTRRVCRPAIDDDYISDCFNWWWWWRHRLFALVLDSTLSALDVVIIPIPRWRTSRRFGYFSPPSWIPVPILMLSWSDLILIRSWSDPDGALVASPGSFTTLSLSQTWIVHRPINYYSIADRLLLLQWLHCPHLVSRPTLDLLIDTLPFLVSDCVRIRFITDWDIYRRLISGAWLLMRARASVSELMTRCIFPFVKPGRLIAEWITKRPRSISGFFGWPLQASGRRAWWSSWAPIRIWSPCILSPC